MKCESKPFTQIDREYKFTSRELKSFLKIEGEIINIGLSEGRSDIEEGISADNDVWYIKTKEVKNKCN